MKLKKILFGLFLSFFVLLGAVKVSADGLGVEQIEYECTECKAQNLKNLVCECSTSAEDYTITIYSEKGKTKTEKQDLGIMIYHVNGISTSVKINKYQNNDFVFSLNAGIFVNFKILGKVDISAGLTRLNSYLEGISTDVSGGFTMDKEHKTGWYSLEAELITKHIYSKIVMNGEEYWYDCGYSASTLFLLTPTEIVQNPYNKKLGEK